MKLVCPFTFSVSEFNLVEPRLERVKFLLSKFYSLNSKFHKIKLITDIKSHTTLDFIKFDEVEYVNTDPFKLVDDFKIFLLSNIKQDELIIDFDVYLKKPLTVDTTYDLIIERYEERLAKNIYKDFIKQSKVNFDKQSYLKIDNLHAVPNIGIVKVNNPKLLEIYTSTYREKSAEFIQIALSQGLGYGEYSVLFGQLLLRDIINKNNYTVFETKTHLNNKYTHFNGDNKYKFSLEQINKITSNVSLI